MFGNLKLNFASWDAVHLDPSVRSQHEESVAADSGAQIEVPRNGNLQEM